jgi:hypothetical protein
VGGCVEGDGENGELDMGHLARAFPMGFPTEEEYDRIWDSQKQYEVRGPDNSLDYEESWVD